MFKTGLAIGGIALLLFCTACGAATDSAANDIPLNDWRSVETEIVIATTVPPEAEQIDYDPDTFHKALGDRMVIPTITQRVSGYSGIIQAMASNQIDLAIYGPGALASLHDLIGEDLVPLTVFRNFEGEQGYYSAILVRADSPYQSIDDLEGAKVGYVDLNSTSGYLYPRWAMREQGIEPDEFFGETGMTGGHIQSVVAISTSQFDAVITLASTGDLEAGLRGGVADRMAQRGLLDMADYRYIWTAGPIPQSAFVVRSTKGQAYIDYLRGVLMALPYEDPGLVETYAQTRGGSLAAVDLAYFDGIIEMRREEIEGPQGAGGE